MLLTKGASISNVVVILTSWAVIKIPMLFVETRFLGFKFTVIKRAITKHVLRLLRLWFQVRLLLISV